MTTSSASTKARRWLNEISTKRRLPMTSVWYGVAPPSNVA